MTEPTEPEGDLEWYRAELAALRAEVLRLRRELRQAHDVIEAQKR